MDITSSGNHQLACTGVSEIVRDRQAVSVRRGQAGRERRQKTAAFLAKRRLDASGVVLEAGLTPYPSRSLRQGFVGSRLRHRCSRRQRKDVRPMPPLAACRPLRGVLLRLRRRPSKCSRRQDGLCLVGQLRWPARRGLDTDGARGCLEDAQSPRSSGGAFGFPVSGPSSTPRWPSRSK